MEELVEFTHKIGHFNFPIMMFLMKAFIVLFVVVSVIIYIYDKYIQRENQLLINYPLIGRLRYFFYALRDPMRQYFGDEKFYESFDKVKWVYDSAERKSAYASFSPGQPQKGARLSFKNANCVLNTEDVSDDFSVTFGEHSANPFTTRSVFGRSAMSDGAISPEGTRAFTKGAYLGKFPINTGEGSLTSNFFYTHKYTRECKFFETFEGTFFAKAVYKIIKLLINGAIAQKVYKHMVVYSKAPDSYLFDKDEMLFYRVNWDAPLDVFPKNVPDDMPDIIFQMGSGLYGVRDENGDFCETRYQKTMRFCKMTEIKMAQGAKQTGGKLLASKVSEEIAYYRGVKAHENLFSPNQFPYAHTLEELFDFMGRLKKISQKPVGVKIVISSAAAFDEYAQLIKTRVDAGSDAYPDFITIDGGEGGSGAAPLEMMMTVGMTIAKALFIAQSALERLGVRERVKLIASEKVLTPDDAIVLFGLGADYVAIARAFMMSAGCIRARECSGAHGRACPVGLATQDKKKRASFLVEKKARNIASYHTQMLSGIRGLLAVMGLDSLKKLTKENLIFKDTAGKTYMDVDCYFKEALVD
ncbi:FMN-binding glutamate synthase family protein [Sulfurimonas paralvinellae]|uniref:FMN-binding glutamate synthase family protein n=1 Tax=Sulfurimonas paralvinellae TaxID=317658 RepID=A0A7M1BA47_9BACT|nr:FMN-binding glutamate synthase family protein [Sulfurimonas paralvinellae]QOP46583.1 FMN-binding glutamate synthase family protein [Sulfurimonas paralvinellae]